MLERHLQQAPEHIARELASRPQCYPESPLPLPQGRFA
jgi:hypothetical protein